MSGTSKPQVYSLDYIDGTNRAHGESEQAIAGKCENSEWGQVAT